MKLENPRGKTYKGKNAAKSAGKRRSAKEERDAVLSLPAPIPHGKVKDHAGEQAALRDAEEKPRHKEASQIVYNAQQRSHDSPGYRECWEP